MLMTTLFICILASSRQLEIQIIILWDARGDWWTRQTERSQIHWIYFTPTFAKKARRKGWLSHKKACDWTNHLQHPSKHLTKILPKPVRTNANTLFSSEACSAFLCHAFNVKMSPSSDKTAAFPASALFFGRHFLTSLLWPFSSTHFILSSQLNPSTAAESF